MKLISLTLFIFALGFSTVTSNDQDGGDADPNDKISVLEKKVEQLRQSIEIQAEKIQNTTDTLESIIAASQEELDKTENNPVPIGFVYVQFPAQPSPFELFPNVTWTDLSPTYAGLFFRAEGGRAEEFGEIQNDSTRQITQIQYREMTWGEYPKLASVGDSKSRGKDGKGDENSGWSQWIKSGHNYFDGRMGREEGLRFFTEDAEVRPVNTAIKIWQRTA